jgi:hypothetical protein
MHSQPHNRFALEKKPKKQAHRKHSYQDDACCSSTSSSDDGNPCNIDLAVVAAAELLTA